MPVVDFSLFSGMETAAFAAVLGRALVTTARAISAEPPRRKRAQLHAGFVLALLPATRPEALALAAALGIAVVHGTKSLPTLPSLFRTLCPVTALMGLQALANRALTGEWSPAGAVRKLATTNPYSSLDDVAAQVIRNLGILWTQAVQLALGGPIGAWAVLGLAIVAVLFRRTRHLAAALLVSASAMVVMVAVNTTARFQNLRYACPSVLLLVVCAALGVACLARCGRVVGVLAAVTAVLAPASNFPRQIDFFGRASANINQQQVEVARRLAAIVPSPQRVLVGDAGAIPYLSQLPSLDGLGLGGYHDLPFARASVHGVAAVVELIERLPHSQRPDLLALYPSWWPGLADVFGRPLFGVRISDNVICGADEKVVYQADWSALAEPEEAPPGVADVVDVGDLVDERVHAYEFPAPHAGWIIGRVLALSGGRPRFDAGRIIPEGRTESFVLHPKSVVARGELVFRTDGGPEARVRIRSLRRGEVVSETTVAVAAREDTDWSEVHVPMTGIVDGDQITVLAAQGDFRDFHVWLRSTQSDPLAPQATRQAVAR